MPGNLPEVTAEGQAAAANAFAGLGLWESQQVLHRDFGIHTVGIACGVGFLSVAILLVMRSRITSEQEVRQSLSESAE